MGERKGSLAMDAGVSWTECWPGEGNGPEDSACQAPVRAASATTGGRYAGTAWRNEDNGPAAPGAGCAQGAVEEA